MVTDTELDLPMSPAFMADLPMGPCTIHAQSPEKCIVVEYSNGMQAVVMPLIRESTKERFKRMADLAKLENELKAKQFAEQAAGA